MYNILGLFAMLGCNQPHQVQSSGRSLTHKCSHVLLPVATKEGDWPPTIGGVRVDRAATWGSIVLPATTSNVSHAPLYTWDLGTLHSYEPPELHATSYINPPCAYTIAGHQDAIPGIR